MDDLGVPLFLETPKSCWDVEKPRKNNGIETTGANYQLVPGSPEHSIFPVGKHTHKKKLAA